jgi:hypothetical protein
MNSINLMAVLICTTCFRAVRVPWIPLGGPYPVTRCRTPGSRPRLCGRLARTQKPPTRPARTLALAERAQPVGQFRNRPGLTATGASARTTPHPRNALASLDCVFHADMAHGHLGVGPDPPQRPTALLKVEAQLVSLVLGQPGGGGAGRAFIRRHTIHGIHGVSRSRYLQARVFTARKAMPACTFQQARVGIVSHVKVCPAPAPGGTKAVRLYSTPN